MMPLTRHSLQFLLTALVLAAVIIPRMAVMGSSPHTDEGFYLYNAIVMHQSLIAGHGLPAEGMLLLYPALLSFLAGADANLFIVFRFADLLVTLICAGVLWRVLQRESGSLIAGALLAAACMLLLNLQPFIMSGFRNSLFAAYIPLLLALSLAIHTVNPSRRTWLLCGAFVALGILLRENLALYAAFGGICILIAHGMRPALFYTLGGAATAALVLGVVILLRGEPANLLRAYHEMSALNGSQAMNWSRFTSLSYRSVVLCAGGLWIVLLLSLLGGARTTYLRAWNLPLIRRLLLWVSIALIPLIEPLAKAGTLYHYSTCLIGIFGMGALFWRPLSSLRQGWRLILGLILCGIFLAQNLKFPIRYIQLWEKHSAENSPDWQSKAWPEEAVENNHFLYMASRAKPYLPVDAYLSTGYQVYVAYGATGHLPPSHALSNLTIAAMVMDEHSLATEIRKCLPAAILIADKGLAANRKLYSVLDSMPEYRLVEEIKPAGRRMGNYEGRLYAINPEVASYCKVTRK